MNHSVHVKIGLVLWLAALLPSCALQPKPYEPPKDTPLQDPPPGKGIVYLLRVPYDPAHITVFINTRKVASIPSERYTAIALSPGRYRLITKADSMFAGDGQIAPPFEIDVQENQRRFLSISGVTTKSSALTGIISVPSAGVIPLVLPVQTTASSSRSWKEVSELDAQGFMSISKPSLPERDAL